MTAQIESVSARQGWDIYQAGVYRYGPSFIAHDDGSIDAWFAAPGQDYEDCVLHKESDSEPRQIGKGFVGQYIKIDEPFVGVSFLSPTWANNGTESVRLTLYKWDTNFITTRKGTPIAQNTCTGYNDNDPVSVRASDGKQFPAGEYLVVLDQSSQYAGVYYFKESNPEFTTNVFLSSSVKKTGSLRGHVLFDDKAITNYWDQVSYQRSIDGGISWTTEEMTLKPTRYSRDQYSICDPAAICFGGYYYIGYTSTENVGGIENHLYVARSATPDGPWEKWNGTGWGGPTVQPIVEFDRKGAWGIGEPSFVVKDDKLYVYYTYDAGTPTTRVATAPLTEDWPASLQQHGTAVTKTGGSDHCDVKYVDAAHRFIAVNTVKRMTRDAYIEVWQSADGIEFEHVGKIEGILYPSGLHNCGISGDESGHIDVTRPQFIAFAYGLDASGNSAWAKWSTYLQPVTIKYSDVSGIESVTVDNTACPVRLYDLNGIEVDESTASHGLYIRRTGHGSEKLLK